MNWRGGFGNVERFSLSLAALMMRRYPWEAGRWRLVMPCTRWSRRLGPSMGRRVIRSRRGFIVSIDLGDWMGQALYATGEYEPSTSNIIERLIGPGDTVLDVGANIGYFSLLAARCVGGSGTVFAFEPSEETRKQFHENVLINKLSNIKVFDVAAGNSDGLASFYLGPVGHAGLSSLRPLENTERISKVRTGRIDDLIPPNQRVSLVKLDIEGGEYDAIQGMRSCLDSHGPDLIIEINNRFLREMGCSAERLFALLADLDYRGYVIEHRGLMPIPSCISTTPFNALFTRKSDLPTKIAVL